jgi:pimeloyl-ACP methyl ester carboxylesterase
VTTLDINGTTIYYERTGQGPAVVFVHGMCGDADVWADQARRLSDRYTCVRYDRRGHTRSARGDVPITAALHADDLAALVTSLDLVPCLVVGSSGGAAVAVDVALRYGHLLRGAVFSEPPLFSLDTDRGAEVMRELMPRLEEAIAAGGLRAGVDAFFSFVCPGLWEMLDEDHKDRYRANADIGFMDLRSPSVDIALRDLASVTMPVLVIAGDQSHPTFRSIASRLASALPDARLVELEGSGHVTYAEQPDGFAEALAVFAAELDRSAVGSEQGGTMAHTNAAESKTDRFDVRSVDGTTLAVWVEGDGPPLVMVHGSIADHTTFDPFVEVLRDNWTTFCMDRRGFGASGDGADYGIECDFADVAAVVDQVVDRTGERVSLWGHSYGANCAMGGATLTDAVHHLVLYEPSLGLEYPPGSIEAIEDRIARGDREGAIVAVLADILEMDEEEIDAFRSSPMWPVRLAAAHTVARECWAEHRWVYRPGQFDAITIPTLFLAGSDSPSPVAEATRRAAAAIGGAQIRVLDGHAHFAHKTDPSMVARILQEFARS